MDDDDRYVGRADHDACETLPKGAPDGAEAAGPDDDQRGLLRVGEAHDVRGDVGGVLADDLQPVGNLGPARELAPTRGRGPPRRCVRSCPACRGSPRRARATPDEPWTKTSSTPSARASLVPTCAARCAAGEPSIATTTGPVTTR